MIANNLKFNLLLFGTHVFCRTLADFSINYQCFQSKRRAKNTINTLIKFVLINNVFSQNVVLKTPLKR